MKSSDSKTVLDFLLWPIIFVVVAPIVFSVVMLLEFNGPDAQLRNKVTDHLVSQYGNQGFSAGQIIRPGDPENDGEKYTIVVCEDKNQNKFNVEVKDENNPKTITNDYGNIVIGNEYQKALSSKIGDKTTVIVETFAKSHTITKDDLKKGYKWCLNNDKFNVDASIYVRTRFSDINDRNKFENKCNKIVDSYKADNQNIYYCYSEKITSEQFKQLYKDNGSIFSSYITDNLFDVVDIAYLTRENGVVNIEKDVRVK